MDFEIDFGMVVPPGAGVKYDRVLDLEGQTVLSSFLPLIAVYGPQGWSDDAPVPQGDPAYSEVALFDVMLTTPAAQVASTGVLGETKNDDDDAAHHRHRPGAISPASARTSTSHDTAMITPIPGRCLASRRRRAALAITETALTTLTGSLGRNGSTSSTIEPPIPAGMDTPA
jgi:hypothetical protein